MQYFYPCWISYRMAHVNAHDTVPRTNHCVVLCIANTPSHSLHIETRWPTKWRCSDIPRYVCSAIILFFLANPYCILCPICKRSFFTVCHANTLMVTFHRKALTWHLGITRGGSSDIFFGLYYCPWDSFSRCQQKRHLEMKGVEFLDTEFLSLASKMQAVANLP